MLKALWGDLKEGRLQRLPYLLYFVLLNVLFIVLVVAAMMFLGVDPDMLEGAQGTFAERLSMPLILLGLAVALLFILASMNIMAKRFRDIGLPGWWSTLGVVAVGALLSQIVSESVGSGFHLLAMLALLLIPTASFNKQRHLD